MISPIGIVSTTPQKPIENMTEDELVVMVSDLSEVFDYLTREDASYEERCFSEQVKKNMKIFSSELTRRRT